MSSALPSRAVAERALHLAVCADKRPGSPFYIVASGSEPGKTYWVSIGVVGAADECECARSLDDCSHKWAARAHADPAVRRQLRALVRGPRRMGREAAEKLMDKYDEARAAVLRVGGADPGAFQRAIAKRDAVAAAIVARLTGHADADDADA